MDEKKRIIITVIISVLVLIVLTGVAVNENLVGEGYRGISKRSSNDRIQENTGPLTAVKVSFPTEVGEIKGNFLMYEKGEKPILCNEDNEDKIVDVKYGAKPTEQFSAACLNMGGYHWVECNAGSQVEKKGDGKVVDAGRHSKSVCALDSTKQKEYWYSCGDDSQYVNFNLPETKPIVANKEFHCITNKWYDCPNDNNPKALIFMPNPTINKDLTCVSLKNLKNKHTLDGENIQMKYVCEKEISEIKSESDGVVEELITESEKTCLPSLEDSDFTPGNILNEYATSESGYMYPGPQVYHEYVNSNAMKFDLLSSYHYSNLAAEFWKNHGWNISKSQITVNLWECCRGGSNGKEIFMNPYPQDIKGVPFSSWDLFPNAHEVGHSVHISKKPDSDITNIHTDTLMEFFAKYTETAVTNSPKTATYFHSEKMPSDFDFSEKWTNEEVAKLFNCDFDYVDFYDPENKHTCQQSVMTQVLVSTAWGLRETIGIDKTNKLIFETMNYYYTKDFNGEGAYCEEGPQETYLEMLKLADDKLYNGVHKQTIINMFENHDIVKDGTCVVGAVK